MKIIHPSGQSYDIFPGTDLELTRYNPFFNDLGEQSIPISLPGSKHNMELLGHPDRTDNKNKPSSRIDTLIQSGAFSAKARQAILSAKKNGTIESSFYLNEGAFYEKTRDLTLHDIFAGESVQFENVQSAATFVYSLLSTHDDRFSCFMVYGLGKTLNMPDPTGNGKFYHHVDREETVDEKPVIIPAGMFITPFVKVKYVLQHIMEHIGYTLEASFMDVAPFNNMVFLNNNADTILAGTINFVDIVPDMSVNEFFNILRKFDCEIIPDEVYKKIRIIPFNDIIDGLEASDLTAQKSGDLSISYHNNYRQLSLISDSLNIPEEDGQEKNNVVSETLSLTDLSRRFPSAWIDIDGSIYRSGYKGDKPVTERIGSLHCNYNAGDELPKEEKSFPDILIEVTKSYFGWQPTPGGAVTVTDMFYPYVGSPRHIRSKLVFSKDEEQQAQEEAMNGSSHQELKPMLCLYFHDTTQSLNVGTIHNRDFTGQKLWDYTLAYNGEDGIYEKFWRKYDELLRNALLEINGEFILTENQKMSLPSHRKIIIDSQFLIPNRVNYVPGKNIPTECSFFTTKLQEPLSVAKTMNEYFPSSPYKWELKTERNFTNSVPTGSWEIIKFKSEPVAYFPEHPSESQYTSGGRQYEKQYDVEYGYTNLFTYTKNGDGVITTYLQAILNS